ncbi:MAG TPA: hypothetical protein VFK02_03380 [Kofleriaceae bacterium]|nr:hypothetical protein [Kofleriaceae bacterium]
MAGSGAGVATHAATYACGQCGAGLVFSGVRTETCPYCASGNFVERPPTADQPRPELVVAFTTDAEGARRQLAAWLGSRTWLADARIRRARIEDLRGVYVPAYLYSAVAHTDYTASIGEHYTEIETREVVDEDGGKRPRTRTVTRTEYHPLAGRHVGYITDVLVSASAGLADAELSAIEPYELLHVRRYSPAVVTGWIAEEFSRSPDDCRRASRGEALDEVGLRLRRFMPGDSHSDLTWRTRVAWESLDPVLVPVWVLAVRYRDDRPPLRVVINGQTGAVAGRAPLAWWKVAIACAATLAIAALIAWLVHGGAPR